MENENELNYDYFPTSYKREDVTKLPAYKAWIKIKNQQGKKVVKCPWCFGFEVFVEPRNHKCPMCNQLYCQKCLEKCVEDEVIHDHDRGCWSKFCGLIHLMYDWGKDEDNATACEYLYSALIFIFGNHVLYTIKYYRFFKKNKLIDNQCVHTFFTYMNLFTNIFYCITFTISFIELFLFLFIPAFIPCYFKIITNNWLVVLEMEVDESPIT